MDTAPLRTTTDSQSQTATQSPQSNVQSISTGTQTSSVQPGTANALLNGQGTLTLNNPALSSISLDGSGPAAATTGTTKAAAPVPKHHLNPALLSLPVALAMIAAVLIWAISRSAKKAAL